MKILILGGTGMLGHTLGRYFSRLPQHEVATTIRGAGDGRLAKCMPNVRILENVQFSPQNVCRLSAARTILNGLHEDGCDASHLPLLQSITIFKPDVIINAMGVIKHHASGDDPLQVVPLNTILPHVLARLSKELGARLVQLSTDCVFSGAKGLYTEADEADAPELYGRSKYMGEIHDQQHVVTLRTSFIGHELSGQKNLLEWFLAQNEHTRGFRRAIYSGLSTVELARVIDEYVLPRKDLHGLYHVSAEPINKYDLICEIARCYGKEIAIEPVDDPVIDRSLDSTRFRQITGFVPEAWPEMISRMQAFH